MTNEYFRIERGPSVARTSYGGAELGAIVTFDPAEAGVLDQEVLVDEHGGVITMGQLRQMRELGTVDGPREYGMRAVRVWPDGRRELRDSLEGRWHRYFVGEELVGQGRPKTIQELISWVVFPRPEKGQVLHIAISTELTSELAQAVVRQLVEQHGGLFEGVAVLVTGTEVRGIDVHDHGHPHHPLHPLQPGPGVDVHFNAEDRGPTSCGETNGWRTTERSLVTCARCIEALGGAAST
jgi:hypothetical protein